MLSLRLLFIFMFVQIVFCQWIDPHSMDTNHKRKLPKPPTSNSGHCTPVVQKNCNSDLHLRRIVRLILSNAYLDTDFDSHEGYINIRLSSVEHQLLVNFSQNIDTEDNIFNEISTIFERALQKPASDKYPELIHSWQQKLYDLLFNTTSVALYGAAFTLFTIYRLVKADFTWMSIFKFFLATAYIIDFSITFLDIRREEEIESMVKIKELGTTPPECDPQKMSWWGFIKTQFESNLVENPCKAYYLATYPNYTYFIAPSKILIRQFRTLIVQPFGDIGEAFGKFGRGMFTSLPWGLNVVIFPIMLVCFCSLTFILFLFITKPYFKISLFHLFTIELGGSARSPPLPSARSEPNRQRIEYCKKNKKSGKEVGFASNHRALVEEVSNNNSSRRSSDKKSTKEAKVMKREITVKKDGKEEKQQEPIKVEIKKLSGVASESGTELFQEL